MQNPDIPQNGQAGATEIEVTPEMIDEGVSVLFDRYSEEVFEEPKVTVSDIYRAMSLASPVRRSQF